MSAESAMGVAAINDEFRRTRRIFGGVPKAGLRSPTSACCHTDLKNRPTPRLHADKNEDAFGPTSGR
jgi:hypothetical protein